MQTFSFIPLLLTRFRNAFAAYPGRLRLGFLTILIIVLVATSVQYAGKVAKPGDSGLPTRSAFLRWRTMVRDVFEGVNVYTGLNEYPNPPIMAVILRPFAELPPVAGAMTWFYAKAALAVLAAMWIFRLVRGPTEPPDSVSDAAKAIAILLALPPIVGDLSHNNVNLFILFLLAGCLELYRRGYDIASGLVLALSIACKVTPLLFLVYFGWKRAGRVVAGCTVGLILWLAVVPGAIFGWERNAELLGDWYRLMVERPLLKGEVTTEHANQALPGVVYRLFTHSPSSIEYLELGPNIKVPSPAAYHNLIDIGRPAAWLVVKELTAAFVLVIVVLCRTPRSERQGWRFAAECGLIALGMLLFSERTWKHHAVILLLPAAAIAHVACSGAIGIRCTRLLFGLLGGAWLLMVLPGLCGPQVGDFAMVYGTHTIAFLMLTAGIVVVLARKDSILHTPP